MLLRSSSTPVLGSLISSISDSPSHNHHPESANRHPPIPPTIPHSHNKISFGCQNFTTFSCIADVSGSSHNGFRRAQSEGNLESLANGSSTIDEYSISISNLSKKFLRKPNSSLLQTIPSFSAYNTTSSYEAQDTDEEEDGQEFEENGQLLNNVFKGEESFASAKLVELNMEKKNKKTSVGLNEEVRYMNGYGNMGLEEAIGGGSQQMYLARGLGVNGIVDVGFGSGTGGGSNVTGRGGGGGFGDHGNNMEKHYKRMVETNPGNPLFLRNYAEFLYQSKGDLQGAEEYYSRAILAGPNDGEVLSQYAKIVWELHRDADRATSYFQQAVQASSEDRHLLSSLIYPMQCYAMLQNINKIKYTNGCLIDITFFFGRNTSLVIICFMRTVVLDLSRSLSFPMQHLFPTPTKLRLL